MPAPVPACANQMDSYLPRAYSHDRYMLLYTVINSTDRRVHQPPNPSKLSPSRPSPSPSRARMACARSHGRRALHTVLVAQACCNRPSIPACCRLIVHPLSANESDITSQVSYANGLSDIAPPPPIRQTSSPQRPGAAALLPLSRRRSTMPQCRCCQADTTQGPHGAWVLHTTPTRVPKPADGIRACRESLCRDPSPVVGCCRPCPGRGLKAGLTIS